MTSKSLSIKLTKESIKSRIGVTAIISLVWFFTFVVPAMIFWSKRFDYLDWKKSFTDSILELLSYGNGWVACCIVVMAIVCGLSSFWYLNSKTKVDFYHSLPVKREMLFAANFIAGILMTALPYFFFMSICVVIGISGGISSIGILISTALAGFLTHMVFYLLIYATVVLAAMLTGNMIIGLLGVLTFFFYFPVLFSILLSYFQEYFSTSYYGTYSLHLHLVMKTSPFMLYMDTINSAGSFNSESLIWQPLLMAFIIALFLIVADLWLYKKRPSEGAGKALVFKISRPIIRIFMVVLIALTMSLVFDSIQSGTGWMLFGLLCGAVITHCVMEAIYHFDVRKIFTNWQQLIICIGSSILIISIFQFDLLGYDSYIPKLEQVQSVAVNIKDLDDWVDYNEIYHDGEQYQSYSYYSDNYIFQNMEVTDASPVLEMARIGIEYNKKNYVDAEMEEFSHNSINTGLVIQYTLNNGKKVTRRYHLPVSLLIKPLAELSQDQNYLVGKYPFLNKKAEDIVSIRYQEGDEYYDAYGLTLEQMQSLYQIYQNEYKKLTPTIRQEELPIGTIRFITEEEAQAIADHEQRKLDNNDYYGEQITDMNYAPIYPSFTETIRSLKAAEIPAGELWTAYSVQELSESEFNHYYYQYEGEKETELLETDWQLTDIEDINYIMRNSTPYQYLNYNLLYGYRDIVEFDALYKQGFNFKTTKRIIRRDIIDKIINKE